MEFCGFGVKIIAANHRKGEPAALLASGGGCVGLGGGNYIRRFVTNGSVFGIDPAAGGGGKAAKAL